MLFLPVWPYRRILVSSFIYFDKMIYLCMKHICVFKIYDVYFYLDFYVCTVGNIQNKQLKLLNSLNRLNRFSNQ